MTDEQIEKGLECLASEKDVLCAGCEYRHFNGYTCHRANAKDALDLIQRQKAEVAVLTEQLKSARADAVREFAKRLLSDVVTFGDIERVLREMTGVEQ